MLPSRIFHSRSRTLPITLYARKREWFIHLFTSVVLCWGGWLRIEDNLFLGVAIMLFFAICAGVALFQLLTKAASLRLSYQGFTTRSAVGQVRTVPWEQVESFVPVKVYGRSLLGWHYTTASRDQAKQAEWNRSLLGVDDLLPETYGMKPETLATLMNELCQCYRLTHHYFHQASH